MSTVRCCVLVVGFGLPFAVRAGDGAKTVGGKGTWAQIVVDLVTPEMNKKALEIQQFAAVQPDAELNLDVQKLGAEGKFSMKAIRQKYGPPTKTETFSSREGGKVVTYQKLFYPPIGFTVPSGGDQPTSLSGPKRLWAGEGILENARAVLAVK